MSLTHYGIFLAYGPTVDLQKEGLGRLLGAFLKAAATREDVRFVIACPYWSKKNLLAFCENEGIPAGAFEIVSTDGMPILLRMYLALQARKPKARKKSLFARLLARLRVRFIAPLRDVSRRVVSTRSFIPWLIVALAAAIPAIAVAALVALGWLGRKAKAGLGAGGNLLRRLLAKWIREAAGDLRSVVNTTGGESLDVRLYRLMEEAEIERMLLKINSLGHVKAWYSPAAFWPGFNRISAPGLLCVPDVLPSEFPVGFAQLEPALMKNFEIVEGAIHGAAHFVTYSSRVKWDLVDKYSASPEDVSVIPHGSWDLRPWIAVRGFLDQELATRRYCERLLYQALGRAPSPYIHSLTGGSMRFLFYPSQFRPNKNLLTLLRAYEYLVRERFIPHKLILTGDPMRSPPVEEFIRDRQLDKDVLCLHGLATPELAACYHLADLAINPSLSEGGFPFTMTEAISVDTPVVLGRIAVTEEVINDPALQEMMLFDPYDWRDAAARIEWALGRREVILEAQREFCARLAQRTWRDVVGDYVAVLNRLAAAGAPVEPASK